MRIVKFARRHVAVMCVLLAATLISAQSDNKPTSTGSPIAQPEPGCTENAFKCGPEPRGRDVEWLVNFDGTDAMWTAPMKARDCPGIAALAKVRPDTANLYAGLGAACSAALTNGGEEAWNTAAGELKSTGTLPTTAACEDKAARHILVGLLSAHLTDPKQVNVIDAPADVDACTFADRPYLPVTK